MKKLLSLLLALICLPVLAGCTAQSDAPQTAPPSAAIANPWSQWSSLEEAETAVGFPFGLPDAIAGSYTAAQFRTMNNELMEVVYHDGDSEVCIRKKPGEGQDISGDYNQYNTCEETTRSGGTITTYHNSGTGAVKQIIHCHGYSWSLVAPTGYWGDSGEDFLNAVLTAATE